MNLVDMRVIVRRDLHDEDAGNYRWTTDEIDRHIAHAVKELSHYVPLEVKATLATVSGSREVDISSLTDRIMLQAVEYPVDEFPKRYQRFALWVDTVTLLGDLIPDGSNAYFYYGKLHTLVTDSSTIPAMHEDLISLGATGYAAVEYAAYTIDRVSVGGKATPDVALSWGKDRLYQYRKELKKLGRKNKVRVNALYPSPM